MLFNYWFLQELHKTFQSIDHIEELVVSMKKDVAVIEEAVIKAEKDLKAFQNPKISSVIKPLLQVRKIIMEDLHLLACVD